VGITPNTGTTAFLSSVPHTTPFTFTIPAGVLTGDVMIVSLEMFTHPTANPAVGTPSSGGGAWTAVSTQQQADFGPGTRESNVTAWQRAATGSDPGSAFTVSYTGTPSSTDVVFWTAALESYGGCDTVTPVDVAGGAAYPDATTGPYALPSQVTGAAGDWALYLVGGAATVASGPAGAVQRQYLQSASGVSAGIWDSGGSAGGAGSAIGGGSFSVTGTSAGGVFTIGLKAAGGGTPHPGAAALAGSGALTAGAAVQFAAGASLAGSGVLAAASLVTQPAAAALSGIGALAAAVTLALPAAAALAGSGSLAPAASASLPASAALSGTGSLTAGPLLSLAPSAALSGAGALRAVAEVTRPGAGPSPAWSAIPSPPRWTCTPRGGTALPVFSPVSALSLECVNVLWMSGLDGTSVDPTGQATGQPELPVQFAFPSTSGNYAEPAQPQTWFTGSWLLGGTSIGFVAQALVGPGGGVVTLTSGQVFDVWSKVVGSPEAPARFVGQLPVY
jgi:hypothetical protein